MVMFINFSVNKEMNDRVTLKNLKSQSQISAEYKKTCPDPIKHFDFLFRNLPEHQITSSMKKKFNLKPKNAK
jgi:hypothetical protein